VDEAGSVGELQVGDLTIWAESAPYTTLAAVIRGTPPGELRDLLQDASETIHRRLGADLASFNGEHSMDAETQPYLQECLLQEKRPARAPVLAWGLVGILLIVPLLIFGYVTIHNFLQDRTFDQYLEALKREPGIVVTDASRSGGRYSVAGLRDPLAVEPDEIARSVGLAAEILDSSWKSYASTDDPVVLRRAQLLLESPETVRVDLSHGTLRLSGSANPDWIVRARDLIPQLPGVVAVDTSALSTARSEWFLGLKSSVEGVRIFFDAGSRTIAQSELGKLPPLAEALTHLFADGYPQNGVRVEVLGMADDAGESTFNQKLSQERADAVRLRLIELGVDANQLFAIGQGEGGNELSARRVTLRVVEDDRDSIRN
jgi:OOP family OmpA-OmpF porin